MKNGTESANDHAGLGPQTLFAMGLRIVVIYPKGWPRGRLGPATGKEPVGKAWGIRPISRETLRDDVRRFTCGGYKPGFGVCLGPTRGPGGTWLGDIEGDGPEAGESRAKVLGDEDIETMGWSSTRGGHLLFLIDEARLRPILARLKPFQVADANQPGVYKLPQYPGLEFRLGGFKPDGEVKQLQSVIPPTPGTDGTPREWNGVETIAPAPDSFYAALEAVVAEKGAPKTADAPKKGADGRRVVTGGKKAGKEWTLTVENRAATWLRAALGAAVKRIESKGPGERRISYRDEAYCLAGYLHYNLGFTEHELASTLKSTCAIGVGPGDPVVIAAVDEAIAAGKSAPLTLPDELHRAALGLDDPRSDGAEQEQGDATGAHGDEPRPRAEIEVTTQRHEMLDEAVAALARDPDLYRRGESLVTVVKEERLSIKLTESTTLANVAGSPKILTLADAVVGCYLTRNATFYQERKDKNGEPVVIEVHPPDWLIKAVAGRKHYRGIRPLLSVAECPYPRPDGSIVETPGYDHVTGTLYAPSIDFPPLPDQPTQDDARAAWGRLRAPIRQFPFQGEDDCAVWLAGLLTAIARPAIDAPVPGIVINGNRAGCGKGLLVDGIGILATGRSVPTSAYPEIAEEAQKVKVAIALSGKPIVHFDNLDEGGIYGNSGLDSALTSPSVNDRILGTSRMTGEVTLCVTWFLTGNNVSPGKDAYRRWLLSNLFSDIERPEERKDIQIGDLRAHLLEHRGEFVRDALTILKAHTLVDRPCGEWAPLGSFEVWDRIVRGAVWFATGRDCCSTRRKAADESPARLNKVALLEGWRELPGGGNQETDGGVATAKAVEMVELAREKYPTLCNALLAFGRDGKTATTRTVGNILRGMRGNIVEGMKFVEAGIEHSAVKWKVVKVTPNSPIPNNSAPPTATQGESGESGESALPRTHPSFATDHDMMTNGCMRKPTEAGGHGHSPDSPDSPTSCDECFRPIAGRPALTLFNDAGEPSHRCLNCASKIQAF